MGIGSHEVTIPALVSTGRVDILRRQSSSAVIDVGRELAAFYDEERPHSPTRESEIVESKKEKNPEKRSRGTKGHLIPSVL